MITNQTISQKGNNRSPESQQVKSSKYFERFSSYRAETDIYNVQRAITQKLYKP